MCFWSPTECYVIRVFVTWREALCRHCTLILNLDEHVDTHAVNTVAGSPKPNDRLHAHSGRSLLQKCARACEIDSFAKSLLRSPYERVDFIFQSLVGSKYYAMAQSTVVN